MLMEGMLRMKQIIDQRVPEAQRKFSLKNMEQFAHLKLLLSETVRKIKTLEKSDCLSYFDNQGNVIEPSQQENLPYFEG